MKAIRRDRPPPRPAGLERTDDLTRSRWWSHEYRFPPYQYKSQFLVTHPDQSSARLLNASERERLMGYGHQHTIVCMAASKAKGNKSAFEDERCSLVGDSFSIGSFSLFAAAAVYHWTKFFDVQVLFGRMGSPPGCGLRLPLLCPLQVGVDFPACGAHHVVEDMNRHLAARARHTGSDVRISTGQVLNPKTLPRQSVWSVWWEWSHVFKTRWEREEHINALELRAIYLTLLWRALNRTIANRRLFHLTDSYVSLSILSKGRTGSHKVTYIVRKINAVLLAAHGQLYLAHIDSADSPTDEGSRA